jgi:bifunctional non-homologous end joining protein LigD
MGLTEYKRKRNFKKTPEPAGKAKRSRTGRQFVVQKHAASRLHYDFRLELDGTLKSWAVPKGPSLDPSVKALAVRVEDHPLDYAGFEGTIPEGEYGGGTVMVWDRGTWEPEGEEDALAAYTKGKLKFSLHGDKLKGSWALVRMGGRAGEDGKNWLLIKHDDKYAKLSKDFVLVDKKPKSVLSKRSMEQIAAAGDRVWSGNGAKRVKTAKAAKTQARRKAAGRKRASAGSAVKKKRAVKKK